MCIVHCIHCMHCIKYTVHCTLFIVHSILYSVYIEQSMLYTLGCIRILDTGYCSCCFFYCSILFGNVHFTVYTLIIALCALYSLRCTHTALEAQSSVGASLAWAVLEVTNSNFFTRDVWALLLYNQCDCMGPARQNNAPQCTEHYYLQVHCTWPNCALHCSALYCDIWKCIACTVLDQITP